MTPDDLCTWTGPPSMESSHTRGLRDVEAGGQTQCLCMCASRGEGWASWLVAGAEGLNER
eukprot:1782779-Pleurochrysis_carterae.AAC.1